MITNLSAVKIEEILVYSLVSQYYQNYTILFLSIALFVVFLPSNIFLMHVLRSTKLLERGSPAYIYTQLLASYDAIGTW